MAQTFSALAQLMLVHLQTAFLFKISHISNKNCKIVYCISLKQALNLNHEFSKLF